MLWVNKSFLSSSARPHHADALLRFHRARPHQSASSGAHAAPACDDLMERLVAETSSADYGSTLLPSAASSSFWWS
ncbi:MAG: hypothetical protein ACLRZH_07505 [Ruthenibacterium lactatiformans]